MNHVNQDSTALNQSNHFVWNQEELLEHFLHLVRIPSPSLLERNVADYIIAFCEKHQIAWKEDNAGNIHKGNSGNIIVHIPGNGKTTILFSAHMDTVLPCDEIHPMIKDGIIYSDGTSILGGDDKSGIAPMLVLMRQATEFPKDYPNLVFVFSIAEEIGLLGARELAQGELTGVEAAFILDSSGTPGECVIAAPNMANGFITIKGKEAHAGNAPELGINALVVASHAISKLHVGRIDEETTCNIGVVQGGLASNIVMASISMEYEARSLDKAKLVSLLESTKTTFLETCASFQADLHFDVAITTPGYRLAEDSSVVQRVRDAAHQIGLTSRCKQSGGGSDTNIYHSLGVRAMTLATGMSNVHTVNECIAIQDLLDTARWIDAIARIFGQ